MQRIRRGDMVQIISGKYKGFQGKILAVLADGEKVLVEGANIKKRHLKPNARMPQGGVVEREAPLHACIVMPVDPETGRPTRVRIRVNDEGKKERIAVKSGAVLVGNP
jgi:large subunit ribosomal protein L24